MTDFREYIANGWAICGIRTGSKGPDYPGWNDKSLSLEAAEALDGAGLMHALSGTAALDIDDMETAKPWLLERGVDVDALMKASDAVMISSGRPNRAKLLYSMKRPLRTLKPSGTGIELRCATTDGKSVQDVLPGSIHPNTKRPYSWKYSEPMVGHWSALPPIPSSLLALWRQLLAEIPADRLPQKGPVNTPIETVRKAIYQYIQNKHKSVTDHDDWLDVGMRLHEQTGGAQEGLDVWDEWSKTDTSVRKNGGPRYPGKEGLELRYRSFHVGRAGNVGMNAAISQLPSEADEFEIEASEAVDEESASQTLQKKAKATKADALAKLEQRLVYVNNAEKYFDTSRRRIINTESAIEHMFTHFMPRKRGGKKESPVQLLKESSTKRYVDEVGFHPGEGLMFKDREGYHYANSYDDSRRAPALEPTEGEVERIEWLFNLIDDAAYRDWLKQFYGYVVQHPGAKIKSAPLIWSEIQGSGKTTLVRMIPSLLVGQRYSKEITATQLEDSFTGYLVDAWHVNLTEFRASSRGEREALSKKVEGWISEDAVTVRPMHRVAYTMPNHFFVTASSNFGDAASIDVYDRKWAIHELKAGRMTDEQVQWIYHEFLLTQRAAGVLRWYFEHIDLASFNPNAKAMVTDARADMVAASASSDLEVMELAFDERTGPFARDVVLIGDVTEWARKNSPFKPNMHRVGRVLAKPPFNGVNKRFRVGDALYRGVIVRNYGQWACASGKELMDHITGLADDLSTDFVDETLDLLA